MQQPGYFEVDVNISSFSFVSFTDLAPFLDELNQRCHRVRATVLDFEPPAAGLTEIAIAAVVAAPAIYFSSFLAAWAAEDAKALRRKMLDAMQKGRRTPRGRNFIPMRIELGRVRFYFHELVTEEELRERLMAANDLVDSLPEEAFEGAGGPGEYGFYWDKKSRNWKGSIYQYSGQICAPGGSALSDEPGDIICIEN